uniref:Cytochrome P450 n=1 Tax=Meloidogyne hapla TaxID=6305 RepID=A0A1I8BBR5_MELHA
MVMVSDVDLLKRYFVRNGDVFSGRWQNFITHMFMDGHNGIIQIQGDKWREQRRFSLHVLRDFGFGRTAMEEKIKDDPAFIRVQQMLDEQSSLVVKPIMGLYLCLPWTVNLPLLGNAWRQLKQIRNDFWAFLDGHISEHLKQFNNKKEDLINSSDFIFAYLNEMKRRKIKNEENGNFDELEYFSEKQLKMLLLDLFFAGSETTVTTTKWGLILLILHTQVQERCFNEIIEKLGQNEPELKDRSKLVYLSATISEIQRMANILPINLLRTCLENIQVDNFHFKAGTMVLPQISITMNDSTYFPEPEKFNPERFIEINKFGELMLKRVDAFLPFSIGKRQCLGESLARAELFFIFAYLIKHFKFLPESEEILPSTKRIYGLTCSPQPFKCRLIARG